MSTKLFVGGLPWATNNDQLKDFFAQAGDVSTATVIFDRMTGKSKGFGFVEMVTEEGAQAALKLSGQAMDGRTITVSIARPPEPRDNNSRGGQGGFRSNHNSRGPRRDDR